MLDELREEVALAFQKWIGSRADSLAGQGFDVAQGVDIVWQDIGGGTYTVIAQMVSHETGVPVQSVEVVLGDSSLPPGPIPRCVPPAPKPNARQDAPPIPNARQDA